jgi:hypothetical protein
MKIRLMGLPDEVTQLLQALTETPDLDLIEVNGPYANRGASRMVRIYIEARLSPENRTPRPGNGRKELRS